MAAPYSNDLRKKVMAALDRGEKKSQVSQMFNISTTSEKMVSQGDLRSALRSSASLSHS